jgi:hypothetical protein
MTGMAQTGDRKGSFSIRPHAMRPQIAYHQTKALEVECDELQIEYVPAVADARPVFEAVIADLQETDTFCCARPRLRVSQHN